MDRYRKDRQIEETVRQEERDRQLQWQRQGSAALADIGGVDE